MNNNDKHLEELRKQLNELVAEVERLSDEDILVLSKEIDELIDESISLRILSEQN
ncbi:MAG: hypothetical protein K0S47_3837 [Herbinix sp.]|jgi:hypothetical protein|nr:hypothetical protein [Herbinix sp.]